MLFLWPDDKTGKIWAYFTGIDKSGRLPSRSRLDKKHEPIGPIPPVDALNSYIELTRSKPLESAMVSQWLANGCLGFGFGVGSGLGSGKGSRASHAPSPSAPGVCSDLLTFWNGNRGTLPEALKLTKNRIAKITARVKADPGFFETFKRALLKARQTPFLCGAGDRGWRANFDWFIANDTNCVAVLEGKYDDAKGDMTRAEEFASALAKNSGIKSPGVIQ
jgi:hypothetical protein